VKETVSARDPGHPRRVLVTGGAGFVGSHIVDRLVHDGDDVVAVDDLSTGLAANVPPGVPLERMDVAGGDLRRLALDFRPDAIVHCAALASVSRSIADPSADARVNILGTIAATDVANAVAARLVYITSGGALAGPATTLPVSEDDPVDPISPYGLSKWVGERYVRLLGAGHAPATVLRLANVYGPRQRADLEGGVIAIFIERLRHGLPLEVHGDGLQTRDFVHVADVVDAVARSLDTDASMTFNVATGEGVSIRSLVTVLEAVSDRTATITFSPARAGDIRHSRLDPRRAAEGLGWRPAIALADGLAELWHAGAGSTERARELP
jgi:UDP-glucose 4-epimerase